MLDGSFEWESGKPVLQDINFQANGNLVAIIGEVGAGKSSLLAALLGEIPKV